MTVYVDGAKNPLGRMVMCHMLADTPEELHTMAAAIGLKPQWYQSPRVSSFPHYDVASGKRSLAVARGAKELSRAECGAFMRAMKRKLIASGKTWESEGWDAK